MSLTWRVLFPDVVATFAYDDDDNDHDDATTTDLEIAIKNNESAKIYNQMALEKMQEYIKTLATLKTKSAYTENENEVLKKKQDRTEARLKQVQSR